MKLELVGFFLKMFKCIEDAIIVGYNHRGSYVEFAVQLYVDLLSENKLPQNNKAQERSVQDRTLNFYISVVIDFILQHYHLDVRSDLPDGVFAKQMDCSPSGPQE